MSATSWRLAAVLGLILCLGLCGVQSKEYKFIADRIQIRNRHVIVDHQPLKNNTLVYAACGIPHERESMNCSVALMSYHTPAGPNNIARKACQVLRRAPEGSYIMQDFQLKLLFSDYVIFMWTERSIKEDDQTLARQLFYRTIDMSNCKSIEKKIDFLAHSRPINVDDFYVVPYQETFDLYFNNETLCRNMMCGLTQNKRGKIINGPVPTYLPSDQFRYENFLYPVKPISAAWGLFILSKQLRLVSSNAGEIKYLMDYPTGLQGQAVSSNNGYLGTCWLPSFYTSPLRNNRNVLNCKQFDSQGNQAMDFTLAQESLNFDNYLALSNLRNGGMLLLTTSCTGHCQSKDTMILDAYKIRNNQIKRVFRLPNKAAARATNHCTSFKDVRAEIFEKDNGQLCWSIFCQQVDLEVNETKAAVVSMCAQVTDAELDAEQQEAIRVPEERLPRMFTPGIRNL
ncbi:uncharacterized protein LOC100679165 isoform X1 [Nasonia vitripennis]|uniref:Uncharacterized protein n=1 Tax=Nasonia vitripennis TaxID=7425 RepID=A0A7M7GH67_NASVI|nr:uncharacterized protein LOC100679165 isoform X1 [Nasonia vitripennis]